MEINETVDKILAYGDCCDHCLGRFFGKRSHGLTNDERGRALRIAGLIRENKPYVPFSGTCWVCGNFFDGVPEWAQKVVAAVQGLEYSTFLVGCRVPPLIAENEEMVWSDLALAEPEPFKSEVNREVGKAVSAITGKPVDFRKPDIVALLDVATGSVEIQVNSVFFYGRYQKFERGIPQTHWNCRACQGAGCEKCNFTGKQYMDSVEELIGRPVIAAFGAKTVTLHGAGREDIDARMVGTGRPFILEVVEPRIRTVDLATLQETINQSAGERISVALKHWCDRADVETLKSSKAHKKYRILVEVEGALPAGELANALKALKGVTIQQRTPIRVAHRRADKIRERNVLDIELVGEENGKFLVEVLGEAGLYIKELISGDQGRTHPSLAEILDRPAHVITLDVVLVEGTEEGD
ncbi:MAG: tRNA pseudouridine(54/55) synthase Pus10 [Methanoregula sp.]|nr:tRNA pseudouridine(54/55) synthase Pus10 [Methanoregula sp.]MDD5024475.1 tRNA pseudouridine(54/55) synthase Pus10 [Methanoregula sp.]MDD5187042.1 tRNA pseudouridine(54/55) synthase Pus10 [Methanoregula sp.]